MVEMTLGPIHLLCAADARYGAYAGIMISSVLRSNGGERIHLHLLSDGVRRRDLRKLRSLLDRAGSGCTVFDVSERLAEFPDPRGHHFSRAIYARLLAIDLLPESVKRLIYVDCDIVCTGSLRPLWELGATIPIAGAVPDQGGEFWKATLGLPPGAPYFNSGVMLINVDAWREQRISRRVLDWIAANPGELRLPDQDAINACLYGAITPLPDCWNLQVGNGSRQHQPRRLAEGVLLHYTGIPKPWVFRFRGPAADIFLDAKRHSPWRFKPPVFRLAYRLRNSLAKRLARWRAAVPAPSA